MRTRTDLSGMTAEEREERRLRMMREYSRRRYRDNKIKVLKIQIDSLTRKIAELEAAGSGTN